MYTPTYLFQGVIVDSYQHTNIGDNKQKGNYMEDDFIGTTFPTPEGGVLTVVSDNGLKGNKKRYNLTCTICSLDTELFPNSFKSTKSTLVSGQIPCGCGRGTRWSEYQYNVKVQRKCKEKGYIFHGWRGSFKSSRTKLILENPSTSNIWVTSSIKNFLRGSGDPTERGWVDDVTNIEDFYRAGFTRDYRFSRDNVRKDNKGYYSFWEYTCPLCSRDEYVKAGLCSGVFTSHISGLKKGVKSCRCVRNPRWTQEQREYQIQKVCKEESLTFLGWEDEKVGYKGATTSKLRYICKKGYTCSQLVSNFLHQKVRCNTCAIEKQKEQGVCYGYYPERIQESDILYILNFDNQYIKIGRSFDIDRRIKQLKKESNITTIDTLYLIKGTHQEIYNLEQFLHTELRDRGFEYETDWGSIECFDLDSLKLTYKLVDEELADNNSLEEGMTKLYL